MKKKKNVGMYLVGSLALAAGTIIVAPYVIEFVSGKLSKITLPQENKDTEWNPVIVRKEKPAKENEDGEL